jgi:probable F420-dependent oxidoreductase
MKFGLFAVNMDACAEPSAAVQIAQKAEALGFDSLWAGEHVVLPDPQVPPSPMAPQDPILDPLVMLSFLAGQTQNIKLGTGIIILPQRNPLVLAKQLASLDVLSNGRLFFGMGAGYLQPEMEAVGVPFEERGARTDEYLAAMTALWTQAQPAYQGEFVSFSGIQAQPQRKVKIVMGGYTPPVFRRAVQYAVGYYGFALNVEGAKQALTGLKEALAKYERPPELGELEISVTPRGLNPDTVAQFAELGVHRLIIAPRRYLSLSELEQYIEKIAADFIK